MFLFEKVNCFSPYHIAVNIPIRAAFVPLAFFAKTTIMEASPYGEELPSMATMNISLPDPLREFVEQEVNAGGYMSVSEYFRELLRDQQRRRAQEKLEALILEGVHSGEAVEVTPDYWTSLKADVTAKHGVEKK
jgi:antitoxin ParD1/3/4